MPRALPLVEVEEPALTRRVADLLAHWGALGLACHIRLEFSHRLSRSLGLSYPARKLIRLNASLLHESTRLLDAVLCHELAHLVVYSRHGNAARPHGPEWRSLVEAAGFEPSVRLAAGSGTRAAPTRRYRHLCPVCHSSRVARRPMQRWRCGACIVAGLGGELRIERLT